ncbi:uncharacterized protein [Aegilops tauschii subsp. strangulata]|uniref:uncharacterized protein n=1 Tax=Aegilops tauschii subsp. strangulata TaxID=200361 RepID=UPI003CC84B0C
MYVCLAALKEGFKAGCRKVVGMDGCFFKGATNGELLCAIGRDANNQMYPIAWAVVEKENNDSWDWFCDLLFRDLEVEDGQGWVFISDQQKGIVTAVQNWAPLAEHRNCARHIYANWRLKFRNKDWQKLFWRCAKASNVALFNHAREKLAKETVMGARAVTKTDPCHWSRAWMRLGSNCDSVDKNMCESFNKWIVEARFFAVITMQETIRRKIMVRIQENNDKWPKWSGTICPNIMKKLEKLINESAHCTAISNGNNCFEVTQRVQYRFKVDLTNWTCSCRYWQLSGLPCAHAVCAIHMVTNDISDYVASCFSVENFKATYSHFLQPVDGMATWPESNRPRPVAPGYVKMPGRPRTERKKGKGEKPTAPKHRMGHNKTKCTAPKPSASSAPTARNSSAKPTTKGSSRPATKASSRPTTKGPVQPSQESTNVSSKRKAPSDIPSTSRRPPSNVSRFKPFKPPQSKVTTTSKATLKNVHVNVSSSSGVTMNFSSGAANTNFTGANKRAKKVPSKLLE